MVVAVKIVDDSAISAVLKQPIVDSHAQRKKMNANSACEHKNDQQKKWGGVEVARRPGENMPISNENVRLMGN